MTFSNRLILALLGLSLCLNPALPGYAQTEAPRPDRKEERAFIVAKRMFEDQIFDLARQRLETFLKEYPRSDRRDETRIMLARCFLFLEQPDNGLQVLREPIADPMLKLEASLWRAELWLQKKAWEKAISEADTVLAEERAAAWHGPATLVRARAYRAMGRLNDAKETLTSYLTQNPASDSDRAVHLLLAVVLHEEGHRAEALQTLNALPSQADNDPIGFEIQLRRAWLLHETNQPEEALSALRKVTDNPRASPASVVRQAWTFMAEWQLQDGRTEEAVAAATKLLELPGDEAEQARAAQLFLKSHLAANSLTAGAMKIREWASKRRDAAPSLLFHLASSFIEVGNHEAAVAELDHLIRNYPASPLVPQARLLMAKAIATQGDWSTASQQLQELVQSPERDIALEAVEVLAGLNQIANHASVMAEIYQRILKRSDLDPHQRARARYNRLLLLARQVDDDAFEREMAIFTKEHPESELIGRLWIEQGKRHQRKGQREEAVRVWKQALQSSTEPSVQAEAKLLIGIYLLSEFQAEEALSLFEQLIREHPESPHQIHARYYRLQALSRARAMPAADLREEWKKFAASFPDHPLADRARLQVAQSFYQEQNYAEAKQTLLELIDSATPEIAAQAAFLAGKSAVWMSQLEEAVSLFEKVPADSAIRPYARLRQITALMRMGDFASALRMAEALLAQSTDPLITVEAQLRRANCLFQLATHDPTLYEKVVQAAETILSGPDAPVAQRNEAGYLKGRALQALGQRDAAINAFLDVLYSRRLFVEIAPPRPEFYWLTRCGQEAARLKEEAGDFQAAAAIYTALAQVGGPYRRDFQSRAEEIRARHFIWIER